MAGDVVPRLRLLSACLRAVLSSRRRGDARSKRAASFASAQARERKHHAARAHRGDGVSVRAGAAASGGPSSGRGPGRRTTRQRRRRRRRRSPANPFESLFGGRWRETGAGADARAAARAPPPPKKQGGGSMFNMDPFGTAGGGSYVPAGMSRPNTTESRKVRRRSRPTATASAAATCRSRRRSARATRPSSRSRATRRRRGEVDVNPGSDGSPPFSQYNKVSPAHGHRVRGCRAKRPGAYYARTQHAESFRTRRSRVRAVDRHNTSAWRNRSYPRRRRRRRPPQNVRGRRLIHVLRAARRGPPLPVRGELALGDRQRRLQLGRVDARAAAARGPALRIKSRCCTKSR